MRDSFSATFRTATPRAGLTAIIREHVSNLAPDIQAFTVTINDLDAGWPTPAEVDIVAAPTLGAIGLTRAEEWRAAVPGDGEVWTITAGGVGATEAMADTFSDLLRDELITGVPLQPLDNGVPAQQMTDSEFLSRASGPVPPGTLLVVAHVDGKSLLASRSRGQSVATAQKQVRSQLRGMQAVLSGLSTRAVLAAHALDFGQSAAAEHLPLGKHWAPESWALLVADDDSRWEVLASGTKPITKTKVDELVAVCLAAAQKYAWSASAVASVALRGFLLGSPEQHDATPSVPKRLTTTVFQTPETAKQVADRFAKASGMRPARKQGAWVIETPFGSMAVSEVPQWSGAMLAQVDENERRFADLDPKIGERIDVTTGTISTAFGAIPVPSVVSIADEMSGAAGARRAAKRATRSVNVLAVTATGKASPPTAVLADMHDERALHGWPLVQTDTDNDLSVVYPDDAADALADPAKIPPGTVVTALRVSPQRENGRLPLAERDAQADPVMKMHHLVMNATATLPALISDPLIRARLPRMLPLQDRWEPGSWRTLGWTGDGWVTLGESDAPPATKQAGEVAAAAVAHLRRYALLAAPLNARALGLNVAPLADETQQTDKGDAPASSIAVDETLHARLEAAEAAASAAQARIDSLTREVTQLRRMNAALAREAATEEQPNGPEVSRHEETAPLPVARAVERAPMPDGVETVVGALEAARLLPGIQVIEAATAAARELDTRPGQRRAWAERVWTQIAEMSAMLTERAEGRWSGSIAEWVRSPATGVPASWFAATESEWVMSNERTRRQRTFDVPGVGTVEAYAHWRIGGNQPPAPRMHVWDAGGEVFVVYAGPHLLNKAASRM